jgi:hypothetical protein
MNQESAPTYLDRWEPGQPSRFRLRIWVFSLVVLAIWTGLFLDPLVGPLLSAVLLAFGLTLALFLGMMALGILGCVLSAAGNLMIARLRQCARWPEH